MLSIRGIITVLVLAALFTYAVIWISRHDGWEGEGCEGVLFRLLITRRTARRRPPPC